MKCTITHIDTACVLLNINGYKILTDPTLDKAGGMYHHGFGACSRKTSDPKLEQVDLESIDLVLLSHHQHKDNFDRAGKALASKVPLVLSTRAASKVLSNAVGLVPWEQYTVPTSKVTGLTITATPAQHHPWWLPGFFSGPVIGFIIAFEGQQQGAWYLSGDTVYFKGIEEVGRRYDIDLALLNAGAAQFRYLTGWGRYTMNGKDLIKSVEALSPKRMLPIHHHGWSHFKEQDYPLKKILSDHPLTREKTMFLESGIVTLL